MHRRPTVASFILLASLAACSRKDAAPGADASADGPLVSVAPDAEVKEPPRASIPDGGFTLTGAVPTEARRARLSKLADDATIAGSSDARALVEKHFSGAPGPFDVQTAELTASGRRALLVAESGKPTSDARPLAFVVDDRGAVLWSKEHPVAGIMAPVGPIAIAPAPLGRVALAACDPPTSVVALRLWDDDGSPFADFQALSQIESCDALSLLYWPRQGWVLVTARPGVTRARLIKENGAPAWGDGLDLGVRSREGAVAAPNIAADTDDSFVLVQLAQPSAVAGSPFHALAFRYDTLGNPIWKGPIDLGRLPKAPASGERVKLSPTSPGVRVTLPSGVEVDLRPSGDFVTRPRAQR